MTPIPNRPFYYSLSEHYETCFEKWGDTCRGVDWPNEEGAKKRYQVMADFLPKEPHTLLDFGCGASHFLEFLNKKQISYIDYTGWDLSEKFIEFCRKKFPNEKFKCLDVLKADLSEFSFDYVIANGVFTEKLNLSQREIVTFFKEVVSKLFHLSRQGIAFNLMSKAVDWERKDLFHLSIDTLISFLSKECSRHIMIRQDYGLYEYTAYVYRRPQL